jgi:pseudouridine-5'-phosphate glycosidase
LAVPPRAHPALLVDLLPAVARAVAEGRPVVALESTVLTHGLPRPDNFDIAVDLERIVHHAGAVPATIAVLDGRLAVGLDAAEMRRVCTDSAMKKLNRRDLAAAMALGWSGGTTVSATMALAHAAGIRVFATGGIGGVHRGGTGDVSTDLEELARTPVAVVCSGAKSILDLDRTLEWLETCGVPVAGWRTDRFPEFFSLPTSRPVSVRVDGAAQAARLIDGQRSFGGGPLICVPCPADQAVAAEAVAHALDAAEAEASAAGASGKDLTPFLLRRLTELTAGATLRANLALLRNNAAVAGEIAVALTQGDGAALRG